MVKRSEYTTPHPFFAAVRKQPYLHRETHCGPAYDSLAFKALDWYTAWSNVDLSDPLEIYECTDLLAEWTER
jgi:hypothetical protein